MSYVSPSSSTEPRDLLWGSTITAESAWNSTHSQNGDGRSNSCTFTVRFHKKNLDIPPPPSGPRPARSIVPSVPSERIGLLSLSAAND